MIFGIKALVVAGITSLISYGPWVPMNPDHINHTKFVYEDRFEDDLANQCIITDADMRILIDHYTAIHPDSELYGTELAFIDASNETGMDPLFFCALCGI